MRVLRSAAAAPETPVAILHRTGFIGQNADARAGRREYVCQYVCQCAMPPVCVYVRVSVSVSLCLRLPLHRAAAPSCSRCFRSAAPCA